MRLFTQQAGKCCADGRLRQKAQEDRCKSGQEGPPALQVLRPCHGMAAPVFLVLVSLYVPNGA